MSPRVVRPELGVAAHNHGLKVFACHYAHVGQGFSVPKIHDVYAACVKMHLAQRSEVRKVQVFHVYALYAHRLYVHEVGQTRHVHRVATRIFVKVCEVYARE